MSSVVVELVLVLEVVLALSSMRRCWLYTSATILRVVVEDAPVERPAARNDL